jgi:hypothetical protein
LAGAAGALGVPILPHGMGAFYNAFGRAIGTSGRVTATEGFSYAAFMPNKGEIVGGAINFTIAPNAPSYKIYAANYNIRNSAGANFLTDGQALIGTLPSNPTLSYVPGSESDWGLLTQNGNPLLFDIGDYIGIYVDTGGSLGEIAVEGTLYIKLI